MDIGMLDRKLADGTWSGTEEDEDRAAVDVDLPILAAAIAHAEEQRTATSLAAPEGSRRDHWRMVARREALRGQTWR